MGIHQNKEFVTSSSDVWTLVSFTRTGRLAECRITIFRVIFSRNGIFSEIEKVVFYYHFFFLDIRYCTIGPKPLRSRIWILLKKRLVYEYLFLSCQHAQNPWWHSKDRFFIWLLNKTPLFYFNLWNCHSTK